MIFALTLTFVACLGDRCRQVEIAWDGPLQTCMLYGGQQAAAWAQEHPGWTVPRGWKCEMGRGA